MRTAAFLLGLILGGIVTFAASWGYFRGYSNAGLGFFASIPILIAFLGFYGSALTPDGDGNELRLQNW